MEFVFIAVALWLIGYILYSTFRHEKSREIELNYHIMQAKRILKSKDLQDKRQWFIDRFKEAESHILTAQSFCKKPFEYNSIADIRKELNNIKKKYLNWYKINTY